MLNRKINYVMQKEVKRPMQARSEHLPGKATYKRGTYDKKTKAADKGIDYNVYKLNAKERAIGFIAGLFAGAAAIHIMFRNISFSLAIGLITGVAGIFIYRDYLKNKRKRVLLLQFKDMLDSLGNSFSAGKNTLDAFSDAYNDLKLTYGMSSLVVRELMIILNGLYNNLTIEDLLISFAKRSGLPDIGSFAETFAVSSRLGGNLKKIVAETRDIITDKIEIEMEIQTLVASNKNEMNVMCAMPFVIIMMMGMLGENSITANTPLNVVVKFIAIVMFITAYVMGRKITDIRV